MTRWTNHADDAVYRARDVVARFEARSIPLPDGILAAVAVLDRIGAAKPAPPAADAIRRLILDDADDNTITAALIADLGYRRLQTETNQAEIQAAQRVSSAFHDAYDALFPALKEQAVEKISHLEKVAELDGSATLDALVRARRVADAQRLAEVDTVAAELDELYELRYALVRRGYLAMIVEGSRTDCTRWRDPRPVDHNARGSDSRAQHLLRGLRSGGELWYPSASEARAAAQPIADEARRKADRAAQTRREQESSASAFAG